MLNRPFCSAALAALITLGCGSTQPPADSPATPSEPAASEPAAPVESAPASEAAPSSSAEESTPPAASAAPEAEANDADLPKREVKYIVTPTALDVEVSGVRFVTTAEPVKDGETWGVKVKAIAKSKDGKEHQLLAPKNGPMAFAGSVSHGGSSERFGDKRDGDETVTLKGSKTAEFVREWPEKGAQGLKSGDELALEVGLWGIGDDTKSRRPLRDFVLVKVKVGKGKPLAVLIPPAGAGKK